MERESRAVPEADQARRSLLPGRDPRRRSHRFGARLAVGSRAERQAESSIVRPPPRRCSRCGQARGRCVAPLVSFDPICAGEARPEGGQGEERYLLPLSVARQRAASTSCCAIRSWTPKTTRGRPSSSASSTASVPPSRPSATRTAAIPSSHEPPPALEAAAPLARREAHGLGLRRLPAGRRRHARAWAWRSTTGSKGCRWSDAFLNAAMLLGGMGPVDPIHTVLGKWLVGVLRAARGPRGASSWPASCCRR